MSHTRHLLEILWFHIQLDLNDPAKARAMDSRWVANINKQIMNILHYQAGEDGLFLAHLQDYQKPENAFHGLKSKDFVDPEIPVAIASDPSTIAANIDETQKQVQKQQAVIGVYGNELVTLRDKYKDKPALVGLLNARIALLEEVAKSTDVRFAHEILVPIALDSSNDRQNLISGAVDARSIKTVNASILGLQSVAYNQTRAMFELKNAIEVATALAQIIADVSRSLTMSNLFVELTLGQETMRQYITNVHAEAIKMHDEFIENQKKMMGDHQIPSKQLNWITPLDTMLFEARIQCLLSVCDTFGLGHVSKLLKILQKNFLELHVFIHSNHSYIDMREANQRKFALYCQAVNTTLFFQQYADEKNDSFQFANGNVLSPYQVALYVASTKP